MLDVTVLRVNALFSVSVMQLLYLSTIVGTSLSANSASHTPSGSHDVAPAIGTLPASRDALRGTAPTSERLIGKFYLQAHKHGVVQQFESCLVHVAETFVSAGTIIHPMCPATFEPLIPHLQKRIKKLAKEQKLGVSL